LPATKKMQYFGEAKNFESQMNAIWKDVFKKCG